MNEIEMLNSNLYRKRKVKINNIEENKKILEDIGLKEKKVIEINSYDYGGIQYHEYNNNLGEGRSGSYYDEYNKRLINLKGIGRTYFTRLKELKGDIKDKEIEDEIINYKILEKAGIKSVKILGILINKDNKILVRSNKTFIRLGMIHKIVFLNRTSENLDKAKEYKANILEIIKNLKGELDNKKCYKKIIEEFKILNSSLEREKIYHNSLSSDNILIDGSLIDLSSLKKQKNYHIEKNYYSLENQSQLIKLYLRHISPLFDINNGEAIEIINEILE